LLQWGRPRIGRTVIFEATPRGASLSWVHYEGTLITCTWDDREEGMVVLLSDGDRIPFARSNWLYQNIRTMPKGFETQQTSRPPSPQEQPTAAVMAVAHHATALAEEAASTAADARGLAEEIAQSHDDLVPNLQQHLGFRGADA